MIVLTLVLVLLLEQWRAFPWRVELEQALDRFAAWLEHQFNAGESHHGILAWCLAVLPALVLGGLIATALARIHWTLALLFNVAVLYATMGFRQDSHHFTAIRRALHEGDVEAARATLAQWRGETCQALTQEEIVRLTIETALIGAHRFVFAVIFWFVVLPGPLGPILYRLSQRVAARWESDARLGDTPFVGMARTVSHWLDSIPARLTASSFAVVGDFEDAVFCWRAQAALWPDRAAGIVLASGAGALGVRLGMPLHREDGSFEDRPELGTGEDADPAHLDSAVGLIWRALVLWLALMLMLAVAHSVG